MSCLIRSESVHLLVSSSSGWNVGMALLVQAAGGIFLHGHILHFPRGSGTTEDNKTYLGSMNEPLLKVEHWRKLQWSGWVRLHVISCMVWCKVQGRPKRTLPTGINCRVDTGQGLGLQHM